jgi:hypothetical protein
MSSASKVGVRAQDFVARATCGDEPDDCADRDAHAPDAGLSAHHGRVTSDTRQLWHVRVGSAEATSIVNEYVGSANCSRDSAP